MPRIPQLRVIVDSRANSGAWNMAVDEAILETAISPGIATLRFYEWDVPTMSLGYFQKSAELSDDPILSYLPVVRRLSGGGAILHDNELTYSLALPPSQNLVRQPQDLYDIVHRAIADCLVELGFSVQFRGQTVKRLNEPLLCFQRQDSHDVTLLGQKVLGSAQRRRRGAILQHGSLVRGASPKAKLLPGLTDLCDKILPVDLAQMLATRVANVIAVDWGVESLTESEIELTKQLCEQQSYSVSDR